MTTAFGPQGPNFTTTRPPADPQASAGFDTFFKNCSAAGAKDGTFATADFFNVLIANLRFLCRTANVPLSDADDTMVYDAVQAIAAQHGGALTNIYGPVTRVLTVNSTQMVTTQANEIACRIRAYGAGGGGGGSGSGGTGTGGGGGEYAEGYLALTPSTAYLATIGAKGSGGVASTNGTDGGDTSFGSLISAKGGQKGFAGSGGIQTTVGLGGTGGTGGQSRYKGGSGSVSVLLGSVYMQALGGYSYGLAWLPLYFRGASATPGDIGSLPGMGGQGGMFGGSGGDGADGQIIIEFFGNGT